ncbi:glycogen-debranching protein [Tessaracoccus sp. OH4464_COT-324]|uniref:glycogen debranching protein n=1 Tax=Tessaracoccus sp. OH4464_COT-324 TaxID=2491059 RepID=UPI000F643D88|nr:alpha-amylase family glycosyl hydrolase [Tessaracoccus sp. OH4464_COT-324]RRD46317.1 glycogen-debranching protein [Tessaracoccus sp. OH4464_COT-324]
MHVVPLEPQTWAEADWPLGAHPHAEGVTFAIYSPAATRIVLEIYTAALGEDAFASFELAKSTDGIWRGKLQGLPLGSYYGFRAWGSNWPHVEGWQPGEELGFVADLDEHGNRFNPNKVLFDPYAREITHSVYADAIVEHGFDDGVFGTGGDDYHGRARRLWDTGRFAPKGVIVAEAPAVSRKPRLPEEDTTIYEVQVEQLSGHESTARLTELLADEPGFADVVNIPEQYRGTYKGAGMMAPYLKGLGITTVEFLPIHETNHSESLREGKSNSWGYMTLGFFAPNRRYSSDQRPGGPTREFRDMVDAFHEHGIEVYLDVVYNHTAEGGNWSGDVNTTGFTSLGGFATSDYYSMTNEFVLVDGATGTSNQLNFSSPAAIQLVLDSLAYWTFDMHVDGFRFDLATVLGRKPAEADREDWLAQKRFFTNHPLLIEIAQFAERNDIEVIAEAWDLWGYEVGNFPRGWGEWNGRYRDAIRRFAKGDGNTRAFLDMLNGDYHHFQDNGGAQKSINFITAHDGFNLADLVSYQEKQNYWPYPFGPSDGGTDDNLSWDSGGSHALRRQRLRNFWALHLFSRGVPMIVAGDEFGRTQNGNNNPWALSSPAMWNNYAMIPTNKPQQAPLGHGFDVGYHDNLGEFQCAENVNGLFRFARFVLQLRQQHQALRQRTWGNFEVGDGDVTYLWLSPVGGKPYDGDRAVALVINSPDSDFFLMVNMDSQTRDFVAPTPKPGMQWRRLIDTSLQYEPQHNYWSEGTGDVVVGGQPVPAWTVAVWQEWPKA